MAKAAASPYSPASSARSMSSNAIIFGDLYAIEPEGQRQDQGTELLRRRSLPSLAIPMSDKSQQENADRRTQLAADRTVFAAQRTYAAWVRTGLAALASGIGAK